MTELAMKLSTAPLCPFEQRRPLYVYSNRRSVVRTHFFVVERVYLESQFRQEGLHCGMLPRSVAGQRLRRLGDEITPGRRERSGN